MMQTIVSWFTKKEAYVEPFYAAREVWSYEHVHPRTKRVSMRPVLVFRKASEGMFWGLPLSKIKVHGKVLYVPRLRNGCRVSALSQMRTLKAARLARKLGTAGEREFATLNHSVVRLLAESTPVRQVRPKQPVRVRETRSLSPFVPMYVLQTR